ncbi:uncharacterized protein [Malus domestica]|uniref:uncharacterized protein n=1 Tax=Malus domestica TaxID=3750 RepID=UPI0010AB2984|nr:uncharacterized protein LOC103406352 isoform X1 [Malus domestica]
MEKQGPSICFHRFIDLSLKLQIASLHKKEIVNPAETLGFLIAVCFSAIMYRLPSPLCTRVQWISSLCSGSTRRSLSRADGTRSIAFHNGRNTRPPSLLQKMGALDVKKLVTDTRGGFS